MQKESIDMDVYNLYKGKANNFYQGIIIIAITNCHYQLLLAITNGITKILVFVFFLWQFSYIYALSRLL